MTKITIIIPALNEEKTMQAVLDGIPPSYRENVIVVDTDSHDKTAEIAAKWGAKVVPNHTRGYDAPCYVGTQNLGDADIAVFLHAGGDDVGSDIPTLLKPILDNQAELVIGARLISTEKNTLLLHQHLGTKVIVSLINLIFKTKFQDMGPFRAIKVEALNRLHMQPRKYSWTTQMVVKSLAKKMRVVEVPVHTQKRVGKSKISGSFYHSFRAMLDMLWSFRFVLEKF